jgi:hypothetical protein
MRLRLAVLLLALTACAGPTSYATTVGVLQPGMTMTVRAASGAVSAFQPAAGEPRGRFTVTATALPKTTPPAPKIRPGPRGIVIDAPDPLATLLLRVPDGVNLDLDSRDGNVNVINVQANARVRAGRGDVVIIVPGYAEASVGAGKLSVTMGATQWPGTLHFSTTTGDIEVWLNENAKFHVRMHTENGTLFSDFALSGSASGSAETIDSDVNGGGGGDIDIETTAGGIRLLKLHPEA